MKKHPLIIIALGALFAPLLVSAQTTLAISVATSTPQSNVGHASEAQVFTACSQAAIELRDSSISSARMAYNNAMAVALDTRKEAEKDAVALEDASEKKDAIKQAVEEYKENVTRAQEGLTKARKEAWATFEENTKECREANKEKKEATQSTKTELKAEQKMLAETAKAETKSVKESFIESIKNLFRR